MKEDLIKALVLLPFILISSGLALGIGNVVFQWLGYELSLLTSLVFLIIGILLVFIERDRLFEIQKTLIKL